MQQAIEWIRTNYPTIGWILLILSIFIQITPIKLNPWSALFKWIGKIITGDACSKIDSIIAKVNKIDGLVEKVDNLKTELDALKLDTMNNEKDRIRWEILDFANSCRHEEKHTRDEFQHIVDLNDKYRALLKATEDSNGVFDIEYKFISDQYTERLEKNDFL